MKELLTSVTKFGLVILIIMGAFYILYLRECKSPVRKDMISIPKSTWDSIQALANKPPEIVVTHDTVKGKPVYIERPVPAPVADGKDSTINHYKDSLVKKDINVKVNLAVRGTLLFLGYDYIPITITKEIDKTIYVPKIVDRPVPISKNGIWVYAGLGGDKNKLLMGLGVNFITKKNTLIGYEYQRMGDLKIHEIKLGMKIGR